MRNSRAQEQIGGGELLCFRIWLKCRRSGSKRLVLEVRYLQYFIIFCLCFFIHKQIPANNKRIVSDSVYRHVAF